MIYAAAKYAYNAELVSVLHLAILRKTPKSERTVNITFLLIRLICEILC